MAKGRKQKPHNLKVLQGTDRPDRTNPDAPVAPGDLPRPPSYLSRRACEWFGTIRARIETMGYASSAHTEMLALVAMRIDEIEELNEDIKKNGHTYESCRVVGTGDDAVEQVMIKANPAVSQRNEAMRHLQSLLAEFGLSPATMSKIRVPKKDEGNAWEGFANG
jgi:P27 family predicted phage terminase small subunit